MRDIFKKTFSCTTFVVQIETSGRQERVETAHTRGYTYFGGGYVGSLHPRPATPEGAMRLTNRWRGEERRTDGNLCN